jgi:2-hydroxychromene-2-carboxylate isomerase
MAAGSGLKFYFSLRSPYSWLAYHDLGVRYPALADRLDWIPFWEPDEVSLRSLEEASGQFVYTPMSRAKHLYVLQDVRRLAGERGLAFTWPVDRSPWWEVPHLAYLVARRHGCGPEFIALAHRARWQEGRDICDREVVGELAQAVGLDPAELRGAVDDPQVRAEGVTALLSIYRDGVFGVPFFVRGYDKYWGIDRLPAFNAAVAQADAEAARTVAEAARMVKTSAPFKPQPAVALRSNGSRYPAVPLSDDRATDDHATDGGHAGGCG